MTLILSGTDGLSDVDGSAATPAIRGTDANTGIFFPSADVIAFSEGGVEAMRMDANGDLLAGTTDTSFFSGSNRGVGLYGSNGFIAASRSNAISGLFNRFNSDGEVIQLRRSGTSVGTLDVSTTGVTMTGTNGITFTATQTASANANTLDDYEEGNWTPTITRNSSDPTIGYGAQVGRYVKIGRLVYASCHLAWSSNTGGSGASWFISGLPFTNSGASANYAQGTIIDFAGITFAASTTQFGGYVNTGETRFLLVSGGSNTSTAQATVGGSGFMYMTVVYVATN